MPPAASLAAAAGQAPGDLFTRWQADTLQTRLTDFASSLYAEFPVAGEDANPNNAPIANWLAVIGAQAPLILAFEQSAEVGEDTLPRYQAAVDSVYRICKLGDALDGLSLITAAQATAILDAYNAQFP